jgi:hypothetical protein
VAGQGLGTRNLAGVVGDWGWGHVTRLCRVVKVVNLQCAPDSHPCHPTAHSCPPPFLRTSRHLAMMYPLASVCGCGSGWARAPAAIATPGPDDTARSKDSKPRDTPHDHAVDVEGATTMSSSAELLSPCPGTGYSQAAIDTVVSLASNERWDAVRAAEASGFDLRAADRHGWVMVAVGQRGTLTPPRARPTPMRSRCRELYHSVNPC